MQPTIRLAVPEDAAALAVFDASLQAEGLDTIPNRKPRMVEETNAFLTRRLALDRSYILVAMAESDVVGMLDVLVRTRDINRHVGDIGVSVLAAHRGKGLAGALLHEAIARARSDPDLCRLELQCAPWNAPAISLYRRAGFEIEAVRRKAVKLRDKPEDDLAMALVW